MPSRKNKAAGGPDKRGDATAPASAPVKACEDASAAPVAPVAASAAPAPAAESPAPPVAPPAASAKGAPARVLVRCAFGMPNDVPTLSAADLRAGVAAGQLDPSPEAVAYARSLIAE